LWFSALEAESEGLLRHGMSGVGTAQHRYETVARIRRGEDRHTTVATVARGATTVDSGTPTGSPTRELATATVIFCQRLGLGAGEVIEGLSHRRVDREAVYFRRRKADWCTVHPNYGIRRGTGCAGVNTGNSQVAGTAFARI
jgi:hypothetical protein